MQGGKRVLSAVPAQPRQNSTLSHAGWPSHGGHQLSVAYGRSFPARVGGKFRRGEGNWQKKLMPELVNNKPGESGKIDRITA